MISTLVFAYVQYWFIKADDHFKTIAICYTVLALVKIVGTFVLTHWFIRSERTESWRNYRSQGNSKYISIDSSNYQSKTKHRGEKQTYSEPKYGPTVEFDGGRMIIQVRPLSEHLNDDIEYEKDDILVSNDDEISQYNRNKDGSIFLFH